MGNACKLREKRLLYLRAFPSKAELDATDRSSDDRYLRLFFLPYRAFSFFSPLSSFLRPLPSSRSQRAYASELSVASTVGKQHDPLRSLFDPRKMHGR